MRYTKALIITLLIYGSFFALYYYLNIDEKIKIAPKPSIEEVKFTIISQEPPQKKVEPQKEIIKKVEKIREPKKVEIKKEPPKKVEIEKEVVKKIEPKKVEVKKEVLEKIVKQVVKKIEIKKEIVQPVQEKKYIPKTQIKKNKTKEIQETLKQKYFSKIKNSINKNKIYPKRAIKRDMQGDVKVKFIISKYGELLNIDILDGRTIFHKSVRKAIENSFPIRPEDGLFIKDVELDLMISYRLN